jgi:hypothetical protein
MHDKKANILQKMLMDENPATPMKMDESGIAAKLAALQDILTTIQSELGGKVKGDMDDHMNSMKKVSVMAPDEKGLTEGLKLASEMAAEKSGSLLDGDEKDESMDSMDDSYVKSEDQGDEVDKVEPEEDSNDTFSKKKR